jgi:hypothetical protein
MIVLGGGVTHEHINKTAVMIINKSGVKYAATRNISKDLILEMNFYRFEGLLNTVSERNTKIIRTVAKR